MGRCFRERRFAHQIALGMSFVVISRNVISENYRNFGENCEFHVEESISYVNAWVLIVDQVKPAILKGTAVRFDLSKGKGIK